MRGMKEAILPRLVDYVAGRVSRDQFEDWFLAITWDTTSMDPDASYLVRRIKLRLAEFLNGDWTEDELRGQLESLLPPRPVRQTVTVTSRAPIERVITGSTGEEVPVPPLHVRFAAA